MYKQLITVACAIDWLIALLFTQAGTFLVGKTHSDAMHGIVPHEFAFGMSTAKLAGVALILAVCLVLHGLWCWRRFRTLGPQHAPNPFEMILILGAPVIAVVIGITAASALL